MHGCVLVMLNALTHSTVVSWILSDVVIIQQRCLLRALRTSATTTTTTTTTWCQVIYIAPLKALVRERISDWSTGLCRRLGKRMVELTGTN
jgi:hypothetical protein